MSDWQPIETAPKDGTYILVWRACEATEDDRGIYIASWDQFDTDPHDMVWWAEGTACHPRAFTHWMPLPEPPRG